MDRNRINRRKKKDENKVIRYRMNNKIAMCTLTADEKNMDKYSKAVNQ